MHNLLIMLASILAFSYTLTKGHYMDGRIDKIDVKRDHKELISLYYRMELRSLIQRLMYEHYRTRLSIKQG